MKIIEVIVESKLRKTVKLAMSNLHSWPSTYNDPYMAYRFGLAMASAQRGDTEIEGVFGPETTTMSYTDADEKLVQMAAASLGLTSRNNTGRGSEENPAVNINSPVKPRGPIRKLK
jgi:hypothetical protein